MNNILDHMDLLNEVDTDNVDELVNVHDMTSPLRDDTFEDSLDKDSVIENSPESSKDYIEVPLVLKKGSTVNLGVIPGRLNSTRFQKD